jgi:hypothetical protein
MSLRRAREIKAIPKNESVTAPPLPDMSAMNVACPECKDSPAQQIPAPKTFEPTPEDVEDNLKTMFGGNLKTMFGYDDDEFVDKLKLGTFKNTTNISIMLSGASKGADLKFGKCAKKSKDLAVHILGPEKMNEPGPGFNETTDGRILRTTRAVLLASPIDAAFISALKSLEQYETYTQNENDWKKETFDEYWHASRRNFLQVRSAEAVYAVAYRDLKSQKKHIVDDKTVEQMMDIGGGTGIACQMYIDRFGEGEGKEDPQQCNLFFFDDSTKGFAHIEPKTHNKWCKWNHSARSWTVLENGPPHPSTYNTYAGIGATILTNGTAAIEALYAKAK